MVVIGAIMRRRAAGAGSAQGGLAYQGAGRSPVSEPVTPRSYSPQNVGNDASARPWERSAPIGLEPVGSSQGGSMIGSALSGRQSWGIPAGFDADGFLKASKANFVNLQDAWDRSDIPALRAMMTDDMLQQIQAQLAEREQQAANEGRVSQHGNAGRDDAREAEKQRQAVLAANKRPGADVIVLSRAVYTLTRTTSATRVMRAVSAPVAAKHLSGTPSTRHWPGANFVSLSGPMRVRTRRITGWPTSSHIRRTCLLRPS